VVVEQVKEGSGADKAGIKPGDLLAGWNRAAAPPANPESAAGQFSNAFDVLEVETEEGPRAPLTLHLERASKPLRGVLPPGVWGIGVRPSLPTALENTYNEAKGLSTAQAASRADRLWRSLADHFARSGDHLTAAFLLMKAGQALNDAQVWDTSYELFDEAIREADLSRTFVARCQTRHDKARVLSFRQLNSEALVLLKAEVAIRESMAPESLATAAAIGRLGSTYGATEDLDLSVQLARRALRIQERFAPDSLLVAAGKNTVANKLRNKGELIDAAVYSRASVALYERLEPFGIGMTTSLNNLAIIEAQEGDLRAAESDFMRVLTIYDYLNKSDSLEVTDPLNNLGLVMQSRGDLAAAERYFRRVLAIRERFLPEVNYRMASSFNNLAENALMRSDLDLAEYYAKKALWISEQLAPGKISTARHLGNLAEISSERKDWPTAHELFTKSATIFERDAPRSLDLAHTYTRLAQAARESGDPVAAEAQLEKALAIHQAVDPNSLEAALTKLELGHVSESLGNSTRAEDLYRQALRVAESWAPGSLECAQVLHALGMLARHRRDLQEAQSLLRRSIDALSSQAAMLGGTAESRWSFDSAWNDLHKDYVTTLLAAQLNADAFAALEHSHAGSLLALLAERDLVIEGDVSPELDAARQRAGADYNRAQEEAKGINAQTDPARLDQLLDRLRSIRRDQEEITLKIKKASPRYGRLRYPQPLDLGEARTMLDRRSLLLSYMVGSNEVVAFAVEPTDSEGKGLAIFRLSATEGDLRTAIDAYRNLLDWRGSPGTNKTQELLTRSHSLYDILIKPAESLIAKYDRILILPDGPLHTLPFGALVRGVKDGNPQYLVEWKPIHTAVSATVYAELKKERRQPGASSRVDVAAFGDPKYPTLPEKKVAVKRGDGDAPEADPLVDDYADVEDPQLRSVARGGFKFAPLPASREEVQRIAALYAPKSVAYLGADATEEQAKALGKDIPIIHFATHAIINERFPLDSALVFSIPEHPKEGQDNGLLQAWEIFERMRIDADLVTLSACDSGLGKEMGGEGLIGLTRAFQYAGARSVLASLWKVEDKATGELMKRFYTYLKSGLTKDEALRHAQIDMIHSADFSQPKDWAAFQLNGDWK
jgi:CHAT domain-containing protein/Tfp pilus assembly protein PilF